MKACKVFALLLALALCLDTTLPAPTTPPTRGASFATVTLGADVIRMMNAAGYDAMAAGNHEFDYGAAQRKKEQQ